MSDNRTTEQTATERLRALLDERGVEHYDGTERTMWGYEQTGEYTGIYRFAASEISGGFLQFNMFRITPEQAIAATADKAIPQGADGHLDKAQEDWLRLMPDGWDGTPPTLGSERTCHIEHMPKNQNLRCRSWLGCSVCGSEIENPEWNYCPNCGARVERDGE